MSNFGLHFARHDRPSAVVTRAALTTLVVHDRFKIPYRQSHDSTLSRPCWRALLSILMAATTGATCAPQGRSTFPEPYACQIGIGSGVLTLQSDTGVNAAEPGFRFARDSRGNFIGDSYQGGEVLKWAPDGKLIARLGKVGDGPGEIAKGAITVFVVDDTLYVRDNHMHWVVFDSEGTYVRDAPLGPLMAMSHANTTFLGGDRILVVHLPTARGLYRCHRQPQR